MKAKITKQELNKLAQLIRDEKTGNNHQAILWAVNYHLPLVLWGVEKPIDLINALTVAAFTGIEPSICGAIGLDRSIEIGSPLLECGKYYPNEGVIDHEKESPSDIE